MRNGFLGLLATLCICAIASGQTQSTTNAMLAQAAIAQSVAAMGGSAPGDSTASGTVQITAGGASESATFTVKTRGLAETRETIQAPSSTQDRVYASGAGSTVAGDSTITPVSMQQACSFQSALFPLPVLQAALNNPDTIFRYVGVETLSGVSVQHVQISNSYSSQKQIQNLSPFSVKDVWLDASTYLPRRIAFDSRSASGPVPAVHVVLDFSGFQNQGGVLYPTTVTESLNGTAWGTFTVQSVVFNSGLTDFDFAVQ